MSTDYEIVNDDAHLPRDLLAEEEATDLAALYVHAVAACAEAADRAQTARTQELADMGVRLRAEQERVYAQIMAALPGAVKAAAAQGLRAATVLEFAGADKLDEFCYLYMIKGPYAPEHRQEMKAMGVKPLLYRLRDELRAAGFWLTHAWQRATNQNTLEVSW